MENTSSIFNKAYLLRQTILNVILRQQCVSRSTISTITGIRPSTITDVTKNLIDEQVIKEVGTLSNVKATDTSRRDLILNKNYARIIGVDVQVHCILAVLTDFCGNILESVVRPAPKEQSQEDTLNTIFECINFLLRASEGAKILGIGVSTIGILNRKSDTILLTFSRAHWTHLNLKNIIAQRYPNIPIFVEDQVISKLYAEKWLDKNFNDVSTILIDSDEIFGCSMYFNNKILRNSHGICGEIAHFSVGEENTICTCGNVNCLLMAASSSDIIRKVRKTLENGTISMLNDMIENDMTRLDITIIQKASAQGDRVATNILTTAALYVGQAISYIINLLGPEQVLLSGSLVSGADAFAATVEEEARKRSLCLISDSIHFRKATFLKYGSALGAACMPMEDFFAFPNYVS